MAKYQVVKDFTSAEGSRFFKGEIVEGTPLSKPNHIDVARANKFGNKNLLFLDFDLKKVEDATPVTPSVQLGNASTDATKNERTLTILAYAGALVGVYYAYKKKKGVGGYIGFMILGGIAGSLTANIVSKLKTEKK